MKELNKNELPRMELKDGKAESVAILKQSLTNESDKLSLSKKMNE